MLRGVNKRIIEVNDTGSDIFDKALFFVKNNAEYDTVTLESEAKRIINSYFEAQTDFERVGYLRYSEQKKKKHNRRLLIVLGIILSAVALGIAVSFLI